MSIITLNLMEETLVKISINKVSTLLYFLALDIVDGFIFSQNIHREEMEIPPPQKKKKFQSPNQESKSKL